MKWRGLSNVERESKGKYFKGGGAIWLHQNERATWDIKWLHYERALGI